MFFFKKYITKTGLLRDFTDVHAHLLPGVDDGAKTLKDSIDILAQMDTEGSRQVILTPHVNDDFPLNTPERLRSVYEMLRGSIPDKIQLMLAAEYMLDAGFRQRMEAGLMTYRDGHVLIETSYLSAPLEFEQLIFEICREGYTPVLAHPERYMYMAAAEYKRLRHVGCCFQLNIFALAGWYGPVVKHKAADLLKAGAYTFMGTDTHGLKAYREALLRTRVSFRQAERLAVLAENNKLLFELN